MLILFGIVVMAYLILAIIFRDKNVSQEIEEEVMGKAVTDYLAKRKLSMTTVTPVSRFPDWNPVNPDLYQKERIKRRIINETYLLGVMSGNRLKEKRERYVRLQ